MKEKFIRFSTAIGLALIFVILLYLLLTLVMFVLGLFGKYALLVYGIVFILLIWWLYDGLDTSDCGNNGKKEEE